MSTVQSQLVCDSSTLTNFKAWAQAISTAFSTFGWTQSSDTGQVNWSSIASVPGSAAFVYEVWQPNDGLTTFCVKVEYGNVSGTNCPSLRLTISTTTNGAGTPTGFVIGPTNVNSAAYTPPSTTTQFECNFSGAAGRFGAMMWRNTTAANGNMLFCIERSLDSSGAYTSAHVTLLTCGYCGGYNYGQQSLMLGVGPATKLITGTGNGVGGWAVRLPLVTSSGTNSGAFNGSIPFDTAAPLVGYYDYPLTVAGSGAAGDFAEGVTFTATLYGSTRTFMVSKSQCFIATSPQAINTTNSAVMMRYD